ncbi:hypothetical protein GCM10010441_17360 [Kitasatospora paracochleata]|uniref:Uncharacterized protein n=1 Tax=Kitasatospora paracochleata TaxID=58354 RepID=A0ABT1IZ13_9ACTN|nr:hypothetical protein [Kitasatospora paracochleata]MCP2310404.1 hypothetical protein [Kitasatospora paracochleata]
MTTTALEPITVRDFLFDGERVSPVDAIEQSLHQYGTVGALLGGVRRLTGSAGRAVEHEVATVTDGLLGLDLLDAVAGGWSRHAALRAAARRTRDAPGSEEVVALATHRITSRHRPQVEVLVDGAPVGTLEVDVDLAFELVGLVAVVRRARLTALRTGQCTLGGRLGVQGHLVTERKRQYDLPGAVRMRDGLRLLPSEPPPGPSYSPGPPVDPSVRPTQAM